MKICFLTNELSFKHGWGRYSIGLIKELANKGYRPLVLVDKTSQENDLKEIESYKLLSSLRSDLVKPIFIWRDYLKIKKIVQDCQIIHSLIEPYAPLAALLAKNRPLFITAHGTYAPLLFDKPLLGWLTKKSFKKANKIFCVSKFTQKEILKKVNLKNTLVINNGVDYDKWQTDKNQIQSKEKIILGVGALKPRKGYHIAILAMTMVKQKYPNLKYYLVGDQSNKEYFNQLKELIKKHDLGNNIIFLEKISDKDLVKLYHQTDLFLLTPVNVDKSFEGFGLVYLEANACGKPVIGTYGCGAEEAITNGLNGLLVPQNNIEKTSQAILKILDNPRLAEELSQNGRKQAQKMDWSNMVGQYIQVYEDSYKKL